MKKLGSNRLDISLLIVRIMLGVVVAAHGAQKLLGWFGGDGFDGAMAFFTQTVGLPYLLALLIILIESIGMLALIGGLFTRAISAILIAIMMGAIASIHADNGFFMNWSGSQSGEGFEFHLIIIALSTVLVMNGSGIYSFDNILQRKWRENTSEKTSIA